MIPFLALSLLILVPPIQAQIVSPPADPPVAAPSPVIVPPVVPTVVPTPTPVPTGAPTVAVTSAPVVVRRTVAPRARPSAATPETPPTRVAPALSPAVPTPPAPIATARPAPIAAAEPAPSQGNWLLPLLAAGIALVALAGLFLVRRRAARRDDAFEPLLGEEIAAPAVAPVAAAPTVTRPRPGLSYRPIRIGLNIITATVEGEITVTNTGDSEIAAVDVRIALLGVASGHADVIAGVHRDPPARLLAPQFVLAPGESKTLRAIAAIGRDDIAPLSAAGRPIFVPMVAVTMAWMSDGYDFRSTQAFAVGIERVDSPRLAPVWLDGPSRVHDGVAARSHGVTLG